MVHSVSSHTKDPTHDRKDLSKVWLVDTRHQQMRRARRVVRAFLAFQMGLPMRHSCHRNSFPSILPFPSLLVIFLYTEQMNRLLRGHGLTSDARYRSESIGVGPTEASKSRTSLMSSRRQSNVTISARKIWELVREGKGAPSETRLEDHE